MVSKKNIEVCFSPNQYEKYKENQPIVIVIDVLRATSAICAAIDYGINSIIPVSSLEEAKQYKDKGYIVAAERKGQIVEGFKLGNSPFGFMNDDFIGKDIVLTTTNGTKAINIAAKDTPTVVIGSLLNLDAICEWLSQQNRDVLCLASGWKDKFNLEDTICAGGIVNCLINSGQFSSDEDSSIAAKYLFQSARDNYFGFLKSSSHRRRLRKLNLNKDIKFCLTPNQTTTIPILQNDRIVKLEV